MEETTIQSRSNEDSAPSCRGHKIKSKDMQVLPGPRMVMDLQWGDMMNESLKKKVVSQISLAYSFNRMSEKTVPMVFTSYCGDWTPLFERVNALNWNKSFVEYHQESLLSAIPKEQMVYLTADTEEVCYEFDPAKYYIIGCLLDHNSKKNATRDFALESNIKMQRLPIPEYITMEGRHVLTINHVAQLICKVANGQSWPEALMSTIPQRKTPRIVEPKKAEEHKKWFCRV